MPVRSTLSEPALLPLTVTRTIWLKRLVDEPQPFELSVR
jgi:hypothetical protein